MSIRSRVLVCLLLLVAAGFYYLADWVIDDIRPRYLESMEESLVDTATILSAMITARAGNGAVDAGWLRAVFDDVEERAVSARIYDLVKTAVNLRVYVTDAQGTVVFDSQDGRDEGKDYSHWNDVYLTLRGKYGARSTRTNPDDPATSILHVASPLMVDGHIAGVVTVCKPVVTSSQFIQSTRRRIVWAALLAGLAVGVLGIVTSTWVTRPIRKLTSYASAVRDGRAATLPKLNKTEIGVMGRALEEMRSALEGKEYVEQYVQTLTHELKGPLSAVHGAAELLQEDMPPERRERFLANVQRETRRIRDIVDRLLFLSSLQSRKGLRDVEDIDLAQLTDDVSESMYALMEKKSVTLKKDWEGPVPMRGERFLVRHAVANLLQNAIDFSSPGGDIEITITSHVQDLVVTVRDYGSGIPSYAVERAFEPFYSLQRPDTGEKSSGLGLTFVRGVAALHGGSIGIVGAEGGGVVATLTLRRSPPE